VKRLIAAFILMLIFAQFCYARDLETSGKLEEDLKIYLPGDIVQIIVNAPPDTMHIIAAMPDGAEIKLNKERRSGLWRGYWEVPMKMRKGTYSAKLNAADVEGKAYVGETAPFMIVEPTLVTLINMVSSKESEKTIKKPVAERELSGQELAEEASRLADEAQEMALLAKRILAGEPAGQLPQKKPILASPAKKQTAVVKKKATPIKKAKAAPAIEKGEEPEKDAVEYIVAARYYMAKQDYPKAKEQLMLLQKKQPKNDELKDLISRIDEVSKASGE